MAGRCSIHRTLRPAGYGTDFETSRAVCRRHVYMRLDGPISASADAARNHPASMPPTTAGWRGRCALPLAPAQYSRPRNNCRVERLGTVITLGNDFRDAVGHVQLADELGYESAWITDGVGRDAFVVLTAFANATAQITLGTSIVTFYPRHPTVMARQALSVDEVSAGRFVLGIGTGHRSSMENQLGYTMGDAVAATREYVDILRQVFTTGRVTHQGEFWNVEWSYPLPRVRELKIVLAALNPPLLELSGEIADGVVLWMASDSYVRDVVVPRVAARARERASRWTNFDIVAPIPVGDH